MLWKEAKAIAAAWAEDHLPDYLRGRQLIVPDFPDERTARFFNRNRSLNAHQLIIAALVEIARQRGAHILHVTLTRNDYDGYLDTGIEDAPEARLEFVQQTYRVEELP